MQNVLDIKKDKKLNFVLPLNKLADNLDEVLSDTLVVIHIYYIDQLEMDIQYIKNIPEEIKLLITVTSIKAKRLIGDRLSELRSNFDIVIKQNRGRDISALLVVAKEKILKYKYVCFVHDKKAKSEYQEEDTEAWNYCNWENTLAGREYIKNVIQVFITNPQIGLLVPPSYFGERMSYGYSNIWGDNYENTKILADRFELKCDIDMGKKPIAIGTVFWARVDALNKLLKYNWTYEDFEEEPMSDDGTISHAIERILPYVAQDSGYETGWVMTDRYAAKKIEYDAAVLEKLFLVMRKAYGIDYISQIRELEKLYVFFGHVKKIYIYGAGNNGKICFLQLCKLGINIACFLVSDKEYKTDLLFDKEVKVISEVIFDSEDKIVISTQKKYHSNILENLKGKNILRENILIWTYQRWHDAWN